MSSCRASAKALSWHHVRLQQQGFIRHANANKPNNDCVPKHGFRLGNCVEQLAGKVGLTLAVEFTLAADDENGRGRAEEDDMVQRQKDLGNPNTACLTCGIGSNAAYRICGICLGGRLGHVGYGFWYISAKNPLPPPLHQYFSATTHHSHQPSSIPRRPLSPPLQNERLRWGRVELNENS
ncbi:hypothetical protein Vadar_029349 [Vaccinium darrowii]|uniref:Uncharacterized protein n=1 Tax=Vaccinium darrowii TaxID=229202 RepID=A0ACB7XKQ7_9ERIC|nr:hypothetical protein Vadar_029349 [Vaccinium darrowii]